MTTLVFKMINYKHIIYGFLYVLILGLLSCHEQEACTTPPEIFRGRLLDSQGKNILDSPRQSDSVDLYYLTNDKRIDIPFEISEIHNN